MTSEEYMRHKETQERIVAERWLAAQDRLNRDHQAQVRRITHRYRLMLFAIFFPLLGAFIVSIILLLTR